MQKKQKCSAQHFPSSCADPNLGVTAGALRRWDCYVEGSTSPFLAALKEHFTKHKSVITANPFNNCTCANSIKDPMVYVQLSISQAHALFSSLYDKRRMGPAAFEAQLADRTEMPVNCSCHLVLKFLNDSHPLMTSTIQVYELHLPPQVDILLGALC